MVNKQGLVKLEGRFEAEVLRVLRGVPGLEVHALRLRSEHRPDVVVRFAGKKQHIVMEFKQHASAAAARQLVERALVLGKTPLVLVAGESTAEARAILMTQGIGVIDGLGNAHLELPGLLLHIEERRPSGGKSIRGKGPTRLTGKAGVAAQALLLKPDREWKVQDLAAEARISAAFAHRVLARLDREALTEKRGAGPTRIRRLTNPTALLDLWAEENNDRAVERTLIYRLARDPKQLSGIVSRKLTDASIEHAITGAAAASCVAPFVTAVPITEVWVAAYIAIDDAVSAIGGDVVESGHNLVFVQTPGDAPLAFRRKIDGFWAVNLMRLYYDLRRDPRRGREQADRLRQEIIRL